MPSNTFNTKSIIPEIEAATQAQHAEAEGFTSFLKAAAEIPGVQVLSMAADLFTPERATKSDLNL